MLCYIVKQIYPMNIFEWSESFDFPASWVEESEDRLTRQFKPEFWGCPQRKGDTKRFFDQTCILDRALMLIPFRSFAWDACIILSSYFSSWVSINCTSPQPAMKFLLTNRPGTRSYRKSALHGMGRRRANEGTGKGTWKWKATFQASRCGVAKGPRRRRMIESCGRARVRTATGTSCSRSQGRPRRTVVPSPSEDPVPFIEIRRIDCRDCARTPFLSFSFS